MNTDDSQHRLKQALVQQLASLQRAGLTHLPKAKRKAVSLPPALPTASPVVSRPAEPPAKPMPTSPASTSESPVVMAKPTRPAPAPVETAADWGTLPVLSLDERTAAFSQLRTQVAACTACQELASTRTQTVFGVGNPQARLCFFGEAPGADEDASGEPFVGRAGQLLNKIIEACTLKREDVYILNVLKCRPPNNRLPSDEEAANCRHFYQRQFEVIRPEFICCLGACAAHNLLNTTIAVGKLRGKFHDYRGAKVVVTYHPSYLLRNPAAKKDTWEDMKMLLKAMGIELTK